MSAFDEGPGRRRYAGGVYVTRFEKASYDSYRWRYESSVLVKLTLALVFVGLTGLGALMKFYIPWTLVPITASLLRPRGRGRPGAALRGPESGPYALLGLLVVPWFVGSNTNPVPLIQGIPGLYQGVGGITILYGPPSGSIIGFIVALFFVGWAVDTECDFGPIPFSPASSWPVRPSSTFWA